MAAVGEILIGEITIKAGLVSLFVEWEVDAVGPVDDGDGLVDAPTAMTPLRWAIIDARTPRQPIMGMTPRNNQYSIDPAALEWNNLNPPQQAAFSTGVSVQEG